MSALFNIALYKDNANNRTIAGSTTGAVGSPTEAIAVETLKAGTITVSGTTVTGTQFTTVGSTTLVSVGDYLTTVEGEPIGIVAVVNSATSLTLTATTLTPIAVGKRFFACSGSKILKNESILLRITPVKNGSTSVVIPDLANFRLPVSLSKDNATNPLYVNLALQGGLGIGDFTGTGANQTVTLEPITCGRLYTSYGNTFPIFQVTYDYDDLEAVDQESNPDVVGTANTIANFPTHLWYVVNPFGETTTNLATNTEYCYSVSDVLPDLTFTENALKEMTNLYTLVNNVWVRKF